LGLHGIIFVKEKMDKDLSRIIRGFKTGCHRAYRELFPSVRSVPSVPSAATESQPTKPRDSHPTHGFLFAPGYNDKLLLAPWEHHNEQLSISRGQCLQLNELAKVICGHCGHADISFIEFMKK